MDCTIKKDKIVLVVPPIFKFRSTPNTYCWNSPHIFGVLQSFLSCLFLYRPFEEKTIHRDCFVCPVRWYAVLTTYVGYYFAIS